MIDAPDKDYDNEGFQYMCDHNIYLFKVRKREIYPDPVYWRAWKGSQDVVWVIRFEILRTFQLPKIF